MRRFEEFFVFLPLALWLAILCREWLDRLHAGEFRERRGSHEPS